MLIFQIKTIISSEKWFNYIVTFCFVLFCFFLNAKNLGRYDAKLRKKRGWHRSQGEEYGRRVHVRCILGEG